MDLDQMIHNLEIERKRIEEALDVLRRLHQIRKPSVIESPPREPGPDKDPDPSPNGGQAKMAKV